MKKSILFFIFLLIFSLLIAYSIGKTETPTTMKIEDKEYPYNVELIKLISKEGKQNVEESRHVFKMEIEYKIILNSEEEYGIYDYNNTLSVVYFNGKGFFGKKYYGYEVDDPNDYKKYHKILNELLISTKQKNNNTTTNKKIMIVQGKEYEYNEKLIELISKEGKENVQVNNGALKQASNYYIVLDEEKNIDYSIYDYKPETKQMDIQFSDNNKYYFYTISDPSVYEQVKKILSELNIENT